jgi:hypothetical protein
VNLSRLRRQLEASRDYLFEAAGFNKICSGPTEPRVATAASKPV